MSACATREFVLKGDAFCACKRSPASFRIAGIARQKNSMYHSCKPLSASHLGSVGPSLSRGLTLNQGWLVSFHPIAVLCGTPSGVHHHKRPAGSEDENEIPGVTARHQIHFFDAINHVHASVFHDMAISTLFISFTSTSPLLQLTILWIPSLATRFLQTNSFT